MPRFSASARNLSVAVALAAMVAGMTGLAFAAVPLYALFCRVTGYGGTTQVAAGPSASVIDYDVTVRFDANVHDLPWGVRPAATELRLKAGETAMMTYVAENRSERETVGTATFNVTPPAAGSYFNKIACFCFTEQTLKPGERVEMPVQFFVDPAMAEDDDLDGVRTITLSYSFYPAPSAAGQGVAQAGGDGSGKRM